VPFARPVTAPPLVAPVTFVPVAFETLAEVDQYRLYESAPDDAVHDTVAWLSPGTAETLVGEEGIGGSGVAEATGVDSALSPPRFTAVTTK
jgi:hypothetical protein